MARTPPHPDRFAPAVVLVVCAIVFLLNHPTEPGEHYSVAAVFFSCLGFALGGLGLIDSRILWSIGPDRQLFPRSIRLVGMLAFILAAMLFLAIEIFVYGAFSGARP